MPNIILLERCEIFSRFRELSLLHTLTHVPVDEGALRVHEIELVVQTRPSLGDSSGVAKHGNASVDGGELASWDADRPEMCQNGLSQAFPERRTWCS